MPLSPRLPERAAPYLEDAAERGRISVRTRLRRIRFAWRSVVQAGLAAAIAYLIATKLIGHPRPFFAPVAAIITLGLAFSERGRRAYELALGVALGIAVGDLLISITGVGAWQLALVVMLAICVGLLVGRSQLLVNQAAVSAALVATLQPPTGGITFARFVDALVGGATALVINGLVLPVNPQHLVQSAARPVLDELAATIEAVAGALLRRDQEAAGEALERARAIDELSGRFADAVSTGYEATRFAPQRRRYRLAMDEWGEMARSIDLAVRNVRVLARGAVRALRLEENVPEDVVSALRELAESVRAVGGALDEGGDLRAVRAPALRAAARATKVLDTTANMSVSVIVGQIRSTAMDLLTGTGMDPDEAAEALQQAIAAA
ncbi:MAG TPA: FUSC family protein [Solirubrobacteraceae bacterium]|nr:FUSC family protein [Solirubrobacteraceae bacterium]